MSEKIRIKWGVQITETYAVELPIDVIADGLGVTIAEAEAAHFNGKLPELIDTNWLAEWEDGETCEGFVSTDDRWVVRVTDATE